jgi:GTPase SAR1 family protein
VIFSDSQRLLYNDAYFQACQNGVAKNTRIPVIIVGQDRGGKTSLKKHLLGQDFDPEELSTDGIEVDVVELTHENAKDPWKGKETEFLKSANEVEEHILEYTAKLVTEKEQNQKSKSDAISSQSEETLPEEKLDKIDKLRNNVDSESPSTTVYLHDFAGQSIYYDTHFCFLKTACPYLLVVDVSSPLDNTAKPRFKSCDSECDLNDPLLKTNFDYLLSWLTVLARLSDVICSEISSGSHCWRYKLPPVVIALTNGDKCEAKYIEEVKKIIKDELCKKKFQNVFIERIHVIDNTSPERNSREIRELRWHLYDLCKDILEQQSSMPVRWLQLEVKLGVKMVKEGLKHIRLDDCREVAKSCKVDDVDSALDFLHNRSWRS